MKISVELSDERPWTVELPVKKSQFKPLLSKHIAFNVEADLSAISGYNYKKTTSKAPTIHSDFQSDPMVETFPRLGAGRAGYFRDHYLKGIGRTLLTANWNWADDTLHHSGHLRACAAIRELLVSDYLKAKGLDRIIVQCEGILIKHLDRKLAGFYKVVTQGKQRLVKPVDLKFQGLSLKRAAFARYSNFCWLVDNRTARPESVRLFMKYFEFYLNPQAKGTGGSLTEKLEHSIAQLNSNFQSCLEIGLNWNAFHNNFSMDGRFVDIEGPLILGGPFIGNLFDRTYQEDFCFPHIGFEILYVHRQIQTSLLHISARLQESIILNKDIRGDVKSDAEKFVKDLRTFAIGLRSPFTWENQKAFFEVMFREKLGLDPRLRKNLMVYAKGIRDFYFNGDSRAPVANISTWRKPHRVMSPNTVQNLVLQPYKGFDIERYDYSDTEWWISALDKIESTRDLDNLLDVVSTTRSELKAEIKPS